MWDRFQLSRFIKGEKTALKNITLNHRRIFILPNKPGLGFVILIILLFLIAFVYNNNLVYFLTFLLASIFFIVILHTFKSLAGLILYSGHSHAVFAEESAGFDITINNPNKIKRFKLQIRLDNCLTFKLDAYEKKTMTLYSETVKRGLLEIGTVTLSTTYPLGFFYAWAPIRFQTKVVVYPKPNNIELPFPEVPGNKEKTLSTLATTKGNDDYLGLKEYQSGDSIKQIDWKAFAKGQGLYSKQYGGDTLTELWLNYEQTPGHNVEERLSQLCRWVIDAEQAGFQYGFTVPGLTLEPNHGKPHYQKCLQALALF